MKKISIYYFTIIVVAMISFTSCYKLQKDYQYNAFTLDPNINMTAKQFLLSRGTAGVGSDTVFKWMQLGIEYAGIDMAEYEKPGRTYIFLHNGAVRTLGTVNSVPNQVTGGFFFDYPIIGRDSAGNVLKSKLDATRDSLRPAFQWREYPQQLVKNYFLYLILQADYTFENLSVNNTSIQTLLAPNTVADPNKVSRLGWAVVKTSPNPDPALAASITFSTAGGAGFDPEGKINLKLINNQDAPINVNDRTNDRTAGYFATNGKVHVYGGTVHPFRYSYQ
ncbi:MAG TPA: hypothetical protein VIS75_04315 [Chitinophagaceae bacterium]